MGKQKNGEQTQDVQMKIMQIQILDALLRRSRPNGIRLVCFARDEHGDDRISALLRDLGESNGLSAAYIEELERILRNETVDITQHDNPYDAINAIGESAGGVSKDVPDLIRLDRQASEEDSPWAIWRRGEYESKVRVLYEIPFAPSRYRIQTLFGRFCIDADELVMVNA